MGYPYLLHFLHHVIPFFNVLREMCPLFSGGVHDEILHVFHHLSRVLADLGMEKELEKSQSSRMFIFFTDLPAVSPQYG